MDLVTTLRADLASLRDSNDGATASQIMRGAAWRSLALFRLTEAARRHRLTSPLASILSVLQLSLHGLDIAAGATLGDGVWFAHPVGCVIGPDVAVGARVKLLGSVTLGNVEGGKHPRQGSPQIESDVVIGAGARILGPVRIGSGASIGANAVVTSDVPAGRVAVGIPARLVPEPV